MKTEQEIWDEISEIEEDIKKWSANRFKISVHIARGKVEALLWVLGKSEAIYGR